MNPCGIAPPDFLIGRMASIVTKFNSTLIHRAFRPLNFGLEGSRAQIDDAHARRAPPILWRFRHALWSVTH